MDITEALVGMVWQFAHKGQKNGKPIVFTGGLSALEDAFTALGWEDPHNGTGAMWNGQIVEDGPWVCDVEGCGGWTVAQGTAWPDTGYWHCCSMHSEAYRSGGLKPIMKRRAKDREASRGPDGILQHGKNR